MSVKVNIGMILYNDDKYLSESIESLLAQTYRHFKLIILDDCSTDNSENIALEYSSKDDRIVYLVNKRRNGLAINYKITFRRFAEEVEYFMWVAGHDIYHPRWLETMVKSLDGNPEAVMAYSLTRRISETGEDLNLRCPHYHSLGQNVIERIKSICFNARGYGNMIYGLFRIRDVRKVGGVRRCLLPDMLLLHKLSLRGGFIQVNE
ncbi:MAG TPA: glycosyltransferase family 2 protein, partial [Nitrospirae bacterium]|nr:glycosyltransferase family 2 protein [Nitrospirota bacterium]